MSKSSVLLINLQFKCDLIECIVPHCVSFDVSNRLICMNSDINIAFERL